MHHWPDAKISASLVARTRMELGLTQGDVAKACFVARRTVARWESAHSTPTVEQLRKLARMAYPKEPRLAAELAAEGDTTLEALGLVAPAPAPPPPPRAFPPVPLLVEAVVHVAANVLAAQPEADPVALARAILYAALERARELGLTTDEMRAALAPEAPANAADVEGAAEGKGTRGRRAAGVRARVAVDAADGSDVRDAEPLHLPSPRRGRSSG